MSNTTPQVITDLGSLHRASIWENIVLKAALTAKGIEVIQTPTASPLDQSPNQQTLELPEQGSSMPVSAPNGAVDDSTPTPVKESSAKRDGPREFNAAALKHLAHGLPTALAPFFQGMPFHGLLTDSSSCMCISDGENVPFPENARAIAKEADDGVIDNGGRYYVEAPFCDG